jgi:heme-degrading monooxygenase HmoA
MHASIWKFTGDPDDLTRRYDALAEELPTTGFIAHLCLRAPDGIVIVDTCPSREAFEAFATGDAFRSARRRHGLPDPTALDDYPVHAAFVGSPA